LDLYRCNQCFHVQSDGGRCKSCGNEKPLSISDETLAKLEYISEVLVAGGFHVFHEPDQEGFKIFYDGGGLAAVCHYEVDAPPEKRSLWQTKMNNVNQRMYGTLVRQASEESFWQDSLKDKEGYTITKVMVRLVRLMVPRNSRKS
jgi:hypothetical protein